MEKEKVWPNGDNMILTKQKVNAEIWKYEGLALYKIIIPKTDRTSRAKVEQVAACKRLQMAIRETRCSGKGGSEVGEGSPFCHGVW